LLAGPRVFLTRWCNTSADGSADCRAALANWYPHEREQARRSRRILASVPQAGQRFHLYLGRPREQSHDRVSPKMRELTAGVERFPQSQQHRAERVALPSEVYRRTSRMTVRRPNLSPARTTCLTLARPRCADFSRDRQPHERVMSRLRSLTWTVVIVPQSQRHSAARRTVPSGIAFRVSARTVSLP